MGKSVVVIDGADACEITADSVGLLFKIADAQVAAVVQRHRDDGRFDEDLRQDHVQLGDDLLDRLHVLLRGVDQQRIGALVRDDLGLTQDLNFARAAGAGALDDVLEALRERVAAAQESACRLRRAG